MAATTTRSIISTRKLLIADHPQFSFQIDDVAHWSPSEQTIYYAEQPTYENLLQMMHELGHALLGHNSFRQDIELVRMERDAWEAAREVAARHEVELDEEIIESALDSYRDWLHAKSRCVACQSAGVQSLDGSYHCPLCRTKWRTNDARQCGLKRYHIKK